MCIRDRLRLRDCKDVELRVWAATVDSTVIETSSALRIGPWELEYPELHDQLRLAKQDLRDARALDRQRLTNVLAKAEGEKALLLKQKEAINANLAAAADAGGDRARPPAALYFDKMSPTPANAAATDPTQARPMQGTRNHVPSLCAGMHIGRTR